MRRKWWWLGMFLAGAGCVRSAPARPPSNEASPAVFRSSLALLVAHREELALTPAQVERFEQMDFAVREKNVRLHHELESLRAQARKAPRPWHGGYQGGGSHDVHGGKGGSLSGPPEEAQQKLQRRARMERMEATLRAMQDNDSQAYLAAEDLLTPAQKPRARELFTQERDVLLKQLDALHYQMRKGDY